MTHKIFLYLVSFIFFTVFPLPGQSATGEGCQTLKSMGIKTVINLRARHTERKEMETAGMKYLEFLLPMTEGVQSFGFNDAWIHLKRVLKNYATQSGKVK